MTTLSETEAAEVDAIMQAAIDNSSPMDLCLFRLIIDALQRNDIPLVAGLRALMGGPPKHCAPPNWDPFDGDRIISLPSPENVWWARACAIAESEPAYQAPLWALLRRRAAN